MGKLLDNKYVLRIMTSGVLFGASVPLFTWSTHELEKQRALRNPLVAEYANLGGLVCDDRYLGVTSPEEIKRARIRYNELKYAPELRLLIEDYERSPNWALLIASIVSATIGISVLGPSLVDLYSNWQKKRREEKSIEEAVS